MSNIDPQQIIITSDNVNLTNCAKEQIHIPSSIQSYGALIIVDRKSLQVVQASINVQDIIGYKYSDLLNSHLNKILSNSNIQSIHNCLDKDFYSINPLKIDINNQTLNLIIHENNNFIYLEFEPIDEQYNHDLFTFYKMTKQVIEDMQHSTNFQELSEVIVKNIRELTKFDRVMVYRFDEDGSGHVIAEAKKEEINSFYGLRYPATDIPQPARKLYILNYIRLIDNVERKGVYLPPHPQTNVPFDLSYCNLRSISPIHVEYLNNMGVKASMSISIIQDHKLWGLIACHHYQPKYISYEVRSACEFLGKVMSLNLIAKADREDLKYKMQIKANLSGLFKHISQKVDIMENLIDNTDLLKSIVDSSGLAICIQDQITIYGQTPEQNQIHDLVSWLKDNHDRNLFYTDNLSHIYPPAAAFKTLASGIIILYLSRIENSYIIWFRPEVAQTIKWAGNPNKEVKVEADGTLTLSPRKSFEIWRETVTGKSLPWLDYEIQQVQELRNLLVDILFKKSTELVELNLELQKSNDELDSFAYIASHDLKEPLRGIYNYSYLLIEDYEHILDTEGSRKLNTLMSLTKKMEKLIDALLHYSRLGRQELVVQDVDIEAIISQDIALILEISQQEKLDIRIPRKIPIFLADKILVEEVFMNLITNGFKYNNQAEKWIELGYLINPQLSSQLIFYVKDNGIGIQQHHQEIIFRIFKRLHGEKKFGGGTGAGLTIVKKIIERHGGKIWVESNYGEGTTFYFTLAAEL